MRKPAVGILVDDQLNIEDSYKLMIMKLCYAYNADVVAFTPSGYNEKNNTVSSFYWTKDGLKNETTLIPHWIECGPLNDFRPFFKEKSLIIDDFTKSKKEVSDAMLKSKFASHVIPTMYTSIPMKIFTLLNMWPSIIIKPLVGARGEKIVCVDKVSDDKYIFSDTEGIIGTYDAQGCISLITKLYNGLTIIVQPRLKFTNKAGQTMDFRINVTKAAEGKWKTIYMIARTGRDSIVSNLSQGGYASLVPPTLKADFGENADKLLKKFEEFAEEIPPFMEEISGCNMLSLGIDVGIDFETLNPYIIEVNYVPQLTFRGKAKYADALAQYYAYLTKQTQSKNN